MNRGPEIRNIAIVAHVDHGKTTLVDELLRQSGQFRPDEVSGECILDSNPLERERGITILAKNCAIRYTDRSGEDYHINIVDTPGHADFGGEVERVLRLADGVLLLVDAAEGPLPQTRYVLGKALAIGLPPIVVINKMDRPDARAAEVLNAVHDLMIDLGADEETVDCPVIYASGRDGWATADPDGPGEQRGDIHPLFDTIIRHIPAPRFDAAAPLQALITSLDYSDYVGRIGVGRVFAGTLRRGETVARIDRHGEREDGRIAQLFQFDGLGRREVDRIIAGDIFAVVGFEEIDIGDTLADLAEARPLATVTIDEPTLHMTFRINDGPFAGKEGKYVTSRQLRDRLTRELRSNVALRVADGEGEEFHVSGRGLMHLGILLENMRREGYELTVGKPTVIFHTDERGRRTEPIERLEVDVPPDSLGEVMQLVGDRRAQVALMEQRGAVTHVAFSIPARGLIGLRSRLLTATRGEAVIHHCFERYEPERGGIPGRTNGVMIATETGQVTAYAVEGLADRGVMFVRPGEQVYEGQIVGEHNKDVDIPVNAVRQKKLTNMRSATKEATVTLKAPRQLMLEGALEFIEQDELVEITPASIRMRKRMLKEADRRRESRRLAGAGA